MNTHQFNDSGPFWPWMEDLCPMPLPNLEGFEALQQESLQQEQSGDNPTKRPKRPPNAFLCFCMDHRQSVREQHPDLPNIQISRILADHWKSMDDGMRLPYKVRASHSQQSFKELNPDYKYQRSSLKKNKANRFDMPMFKVPDIATVLSMSHDDFQQFIFTLYSNPFSEQANVNISSHIAPNIVLSDVYQNEEDRYNPYVFQNQP